MRGLGIKWLAAAMIALMIRPAFAQKFDQDRMNRDIAVAENVLGTLIKQQFSSQRVFFPLEIHGGYQSGYGVTFSLPADFTTPIAFINSGSPDNFEWAFSNQGGNGAVNVGSDVYQRENSNQSTTTITGSNNSYKLTEKSAKSRTLNLDSIRDVSNLKVIEAAKTFLADYGDLISQVALNERVIVSNKGNQPRQWVNQLFSSPKRTHLAVEATKSDLTQFREGKITRQQLMSRIKVMNTETVDEIEPDLELLSSILTRLYGQDISKTYFVGDQVYFERLKDFGAIYYMQMFSGIEHRDYSRRYAMPTLGLADVDQQTRDKKVKELYPKFEQDLKENLLEYGRTIKSLKDDEVLVVQVGMTRCTGCNIPSSLELTVKGADLKAYSSGKVDKGATLSKLTVKKGENQ